jgi:hypothetical protein
VVAVVVAVLVALMIVTVAKLVTAMLLRHGHVTRHSAIAITTRTWCGRLLLLLQGLLLLLSTALKELLHGSHLLQEL